MRVLLSISRSQLMRRQAASQRQLPLKSRVVERRSSPFSTQVALRSARKPEPSSEQKSKPNDGANQNPEMPAFSLSALGLSKNMRLGLIVIISIFGTIETWFYCQAIWRWWKGRKAAEAIGTQSE